MGSKDRYRSLFTALISIGPAVQLPGTGIIVGRVAFDVAFGSDLEGVGVIRPSGLEIPDLNIYEGAIDFDAVHE